MNDPDIVFLDEPTTGLDPRARREVWGIIRLLKEKGKTVFLTTHYMEEAEQLADRVGIIHRGRIIARGSVGELIAAYGGGRVMVISGCDSGANILIRFAKKSSTIPEQIVGPPMTK